MTLLHQIESSPYLSALLESYPEFLPYVQAQQQVAESVLQNQIDTLDHNERLNPDQTAERSAQLRISKQKFTLLWSIAELSGSVSFARLGELQCAFADKSIQVALDITWYSKQNAKFFIKAKETKPEDSGIFILGLGKLGGNDLNFSSDIDLIAFFEKARLQVAPMHGVAYAVTACLKQLSSILSDQTEHGFVWRVDWRLRPHASLRNLSMLAEKALDFYHYSAQPWHRLAMLKARPVAGNIGLGHAFLSELRGFLWRRNLDYRAIDDIAQLKSKINLEHPDLQQQRAHQDAALDQGKGFNLKLGHGGIREIEFMANALQLLWGGRKPALRIRNTLHVLNVLEKEELLDDESTAQLRQAYIFLRRAENHLQMLENAQAYHVPEDAQILSQYLTLSGYNDWDEFNQLLIGHRSNVYQQFGQIFSEKVIDEPEKGELIWHTQACSASSQVIVQAWEDGFVAYGVTKEQSQQFESLLKMISQEIKLSDCNLDESIEKIDDYFRLLPPGGQYFRLLRDFPWLLEKIIAPILLSPTMSSLLHQSPHIIDRFLEQPQIDSAELDTTIVFSNTDYEYRLENLRRLANEELYLRYSHYFKGETAVDLFQQQLSTLAESLLEATVRVACDEMELEDSPIAIIGFGKLGAAGMMPKSDMDLVYLCESMESHKLASKFAAKLNTIINTPMREGRVYELDTRLRPSGQSGSVTISLQSYLQHQLQRAQTWSHLALVPARFVAGNRDIGAQFSGIKREILSRPRDVEQFKFDCAKMLKRVQDQRIQPAEPDQFSAKLRPGGLFELEYLLSCMAVLHCVENPKAAKLPYNALVNEVVHTFGDELLDALDTLRSLQLEIRLFGQDDVPFGELPKPILTHVLNTLEGETEDQLIAKVAHAAKITKRYIAQFFAPVDWGKLADWQETQVSWVNKK